MCIEISEAFDKLHLNGLCYRDISLGNIFAGPNGQCLICDIDNINYDGETCLEVLFTHGFTAPEIIVENAQSSVYTDLYSMAVLMFYIIYRGHPLEGKRESSMHILGDQEKRALYGEEAVYIFDQDNDSNRPTEDAHSQVLCMHSIMPNVVNKAFHEAFTTGLKNPGRRLVSAEWCTAFRLALDNAKYCNVCNAEIFKDVCWNCGTNLVVTFQPLWSKICAGLMQALPKNKYNLWIRTLVAVEAGEYHLALRARNDSHFQVVKSFYYDQIKRQAELIAGHAVALEIRSLGNQTYEEI
jgi:serine/threonine protein kinase